MTSEAAFVLDASALLALLNEEPGSSAVEALLDGAVISSVTWCEAFGKLRCRQVEPRGEARRRRAARAAPGSAGSRHGAAR